MTNEERLAKIYEMLNDKELKIAIECTWCGDEEILDIEDIDLTEEHVCFKCWARENM